MNSIDQQFVEYIVKSLVGNPDAVKIERRIDEKGVLLELTVDPEDLGRVIGKRGATAQSLRTLLRALGTKNDARYNLKIVDNGGPGARSTAPTDNTRTDEPMTESTQDESAGDANDSQDSFSSTSDSDDSSQDTQESEERPKEEDHSSVVSRTRRELEELDDLDV